MKTRYFTTAFIILLSVIYSCVDHPLDEDNQLITVQSKCYIGNFYLYGSDHIDCLLQELTVIDTVNHTINGVAKFGTNLKHVKPAASLSIDSKITPEMGVWTDFTKPRKYTVISGNRQVKKEYTITIALQGE